MAPQTSIPIAATVLGLIGTFLWSFQLCPQLWHSYRSKNTEGLPGAMMLLWSWSALPFGIYAISQNFNVGIQIQPQFFGALCMASWGQCMLYSKKWPTWKVVIACAGQLATNAFLQVLFVLLIRGPYSRGVDWPVTLFGILAVIVLLTGYVPIPFELIKRRGRLAGISLFFLAMDWNGAFFSLMSLVAQNTFDPLFGTLYTLCALIEASMFLSHGIWYFRTRHIRKRAEEAQVPLEEFPEFQEWQEGGFRISWNKILPRSPCSKTKNGETQQDDNVEIVEINVQGSKPCNQV